MPHTSPCTRLRNVVIRSRSLVALFVALIVFSSTARAFTVAPWEIVGAPGSVDVEATLLAAPRWTATPGAARGLADGISVHVTSGFEAALGATTPEQVARHRDALERGLAAWESPVLSFDPVFDSLAFGEITIEAVPQTHPAFLSAPSFSGMAFVDTRRLSDRTFTNGDLVPGGAIVSANIFINVTVLDGWLTLLTASGIAPPNFREIQIQRIVEHEIGHAIGLWHPNETPHANFDTDSDPLTPIVVDPTDPFAGLHVVTGVDPEITMWGGELVSVFQMFSAGLHPDDIGGRDVLYPALIPEPASALLLGLGLASLAIVRRASAR